MRVSFLTIALIVASVFANAENPKPEDVFFKKAEALSALKATLVFPEKIGDKIGIKFENKNAEETIINKVNLDKTPSVRFTIYYIDKKGAAKDTIYGIGGVFPFNYTYSEKGEEKVKNGEILYSTHFNRSFQEFLVELPENAKFINEITSIKMQVELFDVVRGENSKATSIFINYDFPKEMLKQYFPMF